MKPALMASLAASLTLAVWGQLPGVHDAVQIGPPDGAKAGEFSLPDQTGHLRNLESLMGPQGLVLVFFRSADW
jgi:hypothetical protein